MKNCAKLLIGLLIMNSLVACGKLPTDAVPAVTELSATVPILPATASPALPVTPTPTVTPSIVLMPLIPLPTFTRITLPTIAPTIEPTKFSAEIESSIAIETLDAFNGHNLRRISGWSKGFGGLEWMDDSKHLLLSPITGQGTANDGSGRIVFLSYAAIMNLNSAKVWLPNDQYSWLSPRAFNEFSQKSWPQPRVLLNDGTNNSTLAYSLEGELLKTYPGTLIGVSLSGSKILMMGDPSDPVNGTKTKWIDLLNNKEVIFDWQQFTNNNEQHVFWSPDENSVYIVTDFDHFYGNAKTGESYGISYVLYDEEDADHLIPAPHHSFGTWVLNDTYLLTRWYEVYEGIPGFLSFFDPSKKAYRNLSALVGLPYIYEVYGGDLPRYPCKNGQPTAAPGGRYVWVNCQDGGQLIDMQTFKAKTFSAYPEAELEWSADGNFAFLRHSDDPSPQILSGADNQLKPISTNALCYTWHPKQSIFVYMNNKESLSFFDARSMSVQRTIALPMNFDCPVWDDNGNKLIMLGEDESLWQIDYPALNHLEQITQPIKGVNGFAPSPDGKLIAFPVGTDIYIVDTSSKP